MTAVVMALFVITAGIFGPGCKTVQTPNPDGTTNSSVVFDPVAAQATVASIAEIGTYMAVRDNPQSAKYLSLAVVTINSFVQEGQFDPAEIERKLVALKIDGLEDPYAVMGVRAALIFYKNAYASVVAQKLDKAGNLKPILVALSSGISAGLSSASVEVKYNLPRR